MIASCRASIDHRHVVPIVAPAREIACVVEHAGVEQASGDLCQRPERDGHRALATAVATPACDTASVVKRAAVLAAGGDFIAETVVLMVGRGASPNFELRLTKDP